MHLYTFDFWANYTKNYTANLIKYKNICAKFKMNRVISGSAITSHTDRHKKIFEFSLAAHWCFGNLSLSDCYTVSKQIFDRNVSLFLCTPLYLPSFRIVHPFSKQTILLKSRLTHINSIKFDAQNHIKTDFKSFLCTRRFVNVHSFLDRSVYLASEWRI